MADQSQEVTQTYLIVFIRNRTCINRLRDKDNRKSLIAKFLLENHDKVKVNIQPEVEEAFQPEVEEEQLPNHP